ASHGLGRELRTARDLVDRLAFNQLHDKIEAIVNAADLINGADGGVVERRRVLRLSQEMVLAKLLEHAGGQYLDRHISVQFFVPGAIDNAHPSFADLGDQTRVAEFLAKHYKERRVLRSPQNRNGPTAERA